MLCLFFHSSFILRFFFLILITMVHATPFPLPKGDLCPLVVLEPWPWAYLSDTLYDNKNNKDKVLLIFEDTAWVWVRVCVLDYIRTCRFVFVCVRGCACVCLCVYLHACLRAYACMFVHAYISIHALIKEHRSENIWENTPETFFLILRWLVS